MSIDGRGAKRVWLPLGVTPPPPWGEGACAKVARRGAIVMNQWPSLTRRHISWPPSIMRASGWYRWKAKVVLFSLVGFLSSYEQSEDAGEEDG
jgi:hypothetical protein